MALTLDPALMQEQPALARLLELYSYELSDVASLRIGDDGLYGYTHLPRYWIDAERHPYLLRLDGELAGFVLVRQGSELTGDPHVWDMAEFFVLRRHRRAGVGIRAAHAVWHRHPGRWEVRVMERNTPALAFWQRAVDMYVGAHIEPALVDVPGKGLRHVFSLDSASVSFTSE